MLHSICQQIWKTQQWPQDWKRSVFVRIPKKDNAKELAYYHTIVLISHASKISSVQLLSWLQLFAIPQTATHQAPRSPTPGAYSNSCASHRCCHPTISSSVVPFSSCFQSFPASGSFPMSQFSASGAQRIGVSDSTSFLPMNIQDSFPLGLTGWILQSKGLSRVFSKTEFKSINSSALSFL